jgi:hypothetical protein
MKKLILGVLSFMLIATIAQAQPKIEIIGGNAHDWGNVTPKESPLKTKVKIKNVGTEKLVISNVKPSCGCTTAPLDKDQLNPGETATIDVTFNVGHRGGVNSKTIRISSNDPNNSTIVYRLNANVVKAITVTPTYFAFSQMKVGEKSTARVTIQNTSKKDVTLTETASTPDDMVLNIKGTKTLKPGESFELKATLSPTKAGYVNCYVKFKTNVADDPELTVSGYGSVKASPVFNNK